MTKAAGLVHRFDRGVWVLIAVLLVFIILMAGAFALVAAQEQRTRTYVGLASEQQVLSQQVAKYALEAVGGSEQGFARLRRYRDRFESDLKRLRSGDVASGLPGSGARATAELKTVEVQWQALAGHLENILAHQAQTIGMHEHVQVLNHVMPKLLDDADQLVVLLMNRGAPPKKIYWADRQLMLGQRIVNRVNGILNGTPPEHLEEDLQRFGQLLGGLTHGDADVDAVQDADAQERLRAIADSYASLGEQVQSIQTALPELVQSQQAAAQAARVSEPLLQATEGLVQAYEQGSPVATAGRVAVLAFGALALVSLIALGLRLVRDAERRQREAELQSRRNQDAILRLLDEMGNLAEGDLTVSATVTEDFTGAIADAVNFSVEALRHLVATINRAALRVASSVTQTEVEAGRLAEASARQASRIAAAGTAIVDIAASVDGVSRDASESSAVASSSVEIARKGSETVHRTIQGMDAIREHIQETAKRIKRLGESSQEIGDIVGLINDIADQTNILALNAAIQAAMAGDAGRGFAVVADEVQRLAERSGNATRQIEALVRTIQADTHEAMVSMERSTAGVVAGAGMSQDAGRALDEIEMVSKNLAERIHGIAGAATRQVVAAQEISNVMKDIQQITVDTAAGSSETATSLGTLGELADELRRSVAGFRLPQQA